jgi:hypothetical protein
MLIILFPDLPSEEVWNWYAWLEVVVLTKKDEIMLHARKTHKYIILRIPNHGIWYI